MATHKVKHLCEHYVVNSASMVFYAKFAGGLEEIFKDRIRQQSKFSICHQSPVSPLFKKKNLSKRRGSNFDIFTNLRQKSRCLFALS
jgi:hypothetical protein